MKPFVPPPLPWPDLNWEPLIPAMGRANRALAQFNGSLHGVPNPAIMLSPLATQEAVLSSKIEGTQASLDDVLKFEAGDKPANESLGDDVQEVLNYRRALREGVNAMKKRPFNLNLLKELHATLLAGGAGQRQGAGTFPAGAKLDRPARHADGPGVLCTAGARAGAGMHGRLGKVLSRRQPGPAGATGDGACAI